MARKEINIFSVSFLDLMSGAFAAVLILFIIVPKMSFSDQDALATLDELEVGAEDLGDMISQLENSIADSVFEAAMARAREMQQQISSLAEEVNEMSNELTSTNEQNRQLENQLVQTEQELTEIERTLAEAQEQMDSQPTEEEIARLQDQLQEAENRVSEASEDLEEQREESAAGAGGPGASMFGVNAKFAIVCDWEEDVDVDLYLNEISTDTWIHYQNTSESFGKYLGDVTSRRTGDGLFEMIFQPEIVPGTYEVWYHLYSEEGTAEVNGYAVIFPFTDRERKIKFPSHRINHTDKPTEGAGIRVGTITLNESQLTFN